MRREAPSRSSVDAAAELRRGVVLLEQMREMSAAIESGELPVGAAYRHRVEGAITALEAVLGIEPTLATDVRTPGL